MSSQGNPCTEEPDYRLTVVHRVPSLAVLDQHVITDAERRKAAGLIGGDVQALTVAFMRRAPPYDPAWDAKVPERSVLERELGQVCYCLPFFFYSQLIYIEVVGIRSWGMCGSTCGTDKCSWRGVLWGCCVLDCLV